jgi:hypothetical protein
MKTLNHLFLPVLLLFTSCEKELVSPEDQPRISEISLSETSSVTVAQEISVTIDKPTPCHYVSEVKKTTSDKTYSYNIIIVSGAEVCATVIEEESVTVTFDPATNGEYTLNFLINGKLHETRTVTVTE